jgi:hypothetical protein
LEFQRRLSKGLQALASYTFSHSIDSASTDVLSTNQGTPGTIADPNVDRGNSDFDIRHSFTAGATYDLPFPASKKAVHALLGGWSLDTFILARSAPPVNVVGPTFCIAGVALASRPNVVPGVPLELFGSQYPGGKIFNRAAFTAAPTGTQGSFGRNVLIGFGAWQADVGLQRQFHLTEKMGLRFRAEFFNILPSELRQSRQPSDQSTVRSLHPNAGEQSGIGRREWGPQSSLPDWRTAVDSVCAEASVLEVGRQQ